VFYFLMCRSELLNRDTDVFISLLLKDVGLTNIENTAIQKILFIRSYSDDLKINISSKTINCYLAFRLVA